MHNLRIRDILAQQIAAVERSYTAQTGGAAVCQLHKDGRVTGGLKYDEGRLTVLQTARRMLPSADDDQAYATYRAAIESELQNWQAELRAQQAKEQPALPWVAYRQGGVDALTALRELLERE